MTKLRCFNRHFSVFHALCSQVRSCDESSGLWHRANERATV